MVSIDSRIFFSLISLRVLIEHLKGFGPTVSPYSLRQRSEMFRNVGRSTPLPCQGLLHQHELLPRSEDPWLPQIEATTQAS
jgi:hypothetical protein